MSGGRAELVVDGVVKRFAVGRRKPPVLALAGVSVTVPAGGLVSLVGASGCGKSTLLNIAGGLEDATAGTVAVRMPLHPVAIELLGRTGPMAVSSANISGRPPATTVDEAVDQLGGAAEVYLDGGPCPAAVASTIVDCTGDVPIVLSSGAVELETLRSVLPLVREPAGR